MIKTNIIKIKGNWKEVLNDCRFTANKCDIDKEPSEQFKENILISEHSPIRDIMFKWEWLNLPHWVTVHWVRHKWEKMVVSQRTDKTGINRNKLPQDEPQNMRGEANVQHLIDTQRKRLCYKASPETRECAESLKIEITRNYDMYIGNVLVPNCIYRCGCPEQETCGFFDKFVKQFPEDKNIYSIKDRYKVYNKKFKEKHFGD